MEARVSFVRERAQGEKRVIALPKHLQQYRAAGIDTLVEAGLGAELGIGDAAYAEHGARIVDTSTAWGAPIVLKYKPPAPADWVFARTGQVIGAIFHAEGDPLLVERLVQRELTAFSYEFFRLEDGTFPLGRPGGEIAGQMAVVYGAYHLQSHLGGCGRLLSGVVGARPAHVLIIGHGNAGGAAARLAHAMGAKVTVLGRDAASLRRFAGSVDGRVDTKIGSYATLKSLLPTVDLVIGAILISTLDTPPIIDQRLLKLMRPGSVIVDVTCGYGSGYLPTFNEEATTFERPTYVRNGVVHCKLDALPKAVPLTSSEAYAETATPYLVDLCSSWYSGCVTPTALAGKITEDGRVVHPVVAWHMAQTGRSSE